MGLFSGQLANVVEWEEYRDDVIFYKWDNNEIKKGSRLIIRPGQDAVFHRGPGRGLRRRAGEVFGRDPAVGPREPTAGADHPAGRAAAAGERITRRSL